MAILHKSFVLDKPNFREGWPNFYENEKIDKKMSNRLRNLWKEKPTEY